MVSLLRIKENSTHLNRRYFQLMITISVECNPEWMANLNLEESSNKFFNGKKVSLFWVMYIIFSMG